MSLEQLLREPDNLQAEIDKVNAQIETLMQQHYECFVSQDSRLADIRSRVYQGPSTLY